MLDRPVESSIDNPAMPVSIARVTLAGNLLCFVGKAALEISVDR